MFDESVLGAEAFEWVTPDTQRGKQLAAGEFVPQQPGWYRDPIRHNEARFFNGESWTGRHRSIPESVRGSQQAMLSRVEADERRRKADQDRRKAKARADAEFKEQYKCVIRNAVILSFHDALAHAPTGAQVILGVTDSRLELWPGVGRPGVGVFPNAKPDHRIAAIERAGIIALEVNGGEAYTTGGGFIGGGFGIGGAAIGMAAGALLNALTTRTRMTPVVIAITTETGQIVLAVTNQMLHDIKGLLAPLQVDVAKNAARLAMPPTIAAAAEHDPLQVLERLGELRERGLLTDEEFAQKKAELLRRL